MKTPNIENLAKEGILFENAFSNVPTCGASRASLMAGLRPTSKRFVRYYSKLDEDAPGALTMPRYLKDNGYHTVSLGKVMHHIDDARSQWSEEPWNPRYDADSRTGHHDYQLAENIESFVKENIRPPVEQADVADEAYFDGKVASRAIDTLKRLKQKDQPFFLGIGFVKPHLPFTAPKKYWDLYDPKEVALTPVPDFPESAPQEAWHNSLELRQYSGIPKAPEAISKEMARTLVRGYHASSSYVDAQIGRVLAAIDRLGLSEDTIVILSSDHGWSLGDHALWNKHSTFNVASQVPLIIRVPAIKGGKRVPSLVEHVDIFPTVAKLAGLAVPEHLHGRHFVDNLHNSETTTKPAIFHRYYRGEAMRTSRFSYTAWFNEKGDIQAQMLYDHQNDARETINVAEHPDYADNVQDLQKRLIQHIKERDFRTLQETP